MQSLDSVTEGDDGGGKTIFSGSGSETYGWDAT